MAKKKYKNYIIWRGTNPRLIDIVLSEHNPNVDHDYPDAAGDWWTQIRKYYGTLIGEHQNWDEMLVSGDDEFIEDMQNCGAIP